MLRVDEYFARDRSVDRKIQMKFDASVNSAQLLESINGAVLYCSAFLGLKLILSAHLQVRFQSKLFCIHYFLPFSFLVNCINRATSTFSVWGQHISPSTCFVITQLKIVTVSRNRQNSVHLQLQSLSEQGFQISPTDSILIGSS